MTKISEKKSQGMCLAMAVVICILFTGAGRRYVVSEERFDKALSPALLAAVKEIPLKDLSFQDWTLKMDRGLKEKNSRDLNLLMEYRGAAYRLALTDKE
ncbi:hypothetical protein [Aminipila luticellarii]|uniref:Uncharacterized protein n=1 Tax=Aminipila luticellarii TaxID=2507160 RepID=A0A410PWF0_9FIRM|nr:hypothetical protein [Aminipila luticellarii]QAT43245.1 hypothetical protein EQM06_08430 [Aminipila luticellarii]